MNVFVQLLATDDVEPQPSIAAGTFDVEDNVGEGIHIHYRNLRIDMSLDDFQHFTDNLHGAREALDRGDR